MMKIKFLLCVIAVCCLAFPPVCAAQTIFRTPAGAARALFSARQNNNKKAARRAATSAAVEKLFGTRRQTMTFKGCNKREEGDYECLFENAKIDLTMAMIVQIYRGGYRVSELSFSSEAL